jgi:hypothetical protein
MANLAKEARDKAQARWPGATVSARGRNAIVHLHPTDPRRGMIDTTIGPMHYGAGDNTEIDTAWEPSITQPWLWQMVEAAYNVYAGPGTTDFDAGQIIEYVHPASGETVAFQPQQIQWTNDLDMIQAIASPQPVSSSIDDDTINWQGAYGPGLDFQWIAQTARLGKRLTIANLAAIGAPTQTIIDGGDPVLKLPFIFQKSNAIDIYIDGVLWDEKSNNPQESTGDVEFRLSATGEPLWWFKQAWVEDKSEDVTQPTITQRFRAQAQNLFVEILIPWAWLETAVYPVTVDPSVDYQIAASSDDAAELSGTVYVNDIGARDINQAGEFYGFRWPGVTIPDGATIDTAEMDMVIAGSTADNPFHTLDFEDNDTPAAFTTGSSDISNRTGTTETLEFGDGSDLSCPGEGAWLSALVTLPFPELKTIIQELVDSYDYSSGLAMVARLEGDLGDAGDHLRVRSYDFHSSVAAKLHIEYTEGGGTEYQESVAGTLTSSGAIVKQTSVSYAGTLTSSGTLATLGTFYRALAGTLTSAGTVVKKTAVSYVGTLTSSGVLATSLTFIRSLAGTLTSSGTIAKQTAVSYAGTLTSSGTVETIGSFFRAFEGTLTSSGALVKETATSLAGTLTSSGTLVKTTLLSLAGTLTSSGTLVKQTAVSYAGTLTSAGTIVKETALSFAGTLTSSGILATTKTALISLAGTLTSSGTLVKKTAVSYAGALTSAGTVIKETAMFYAGTLTSSGSLVRKTITSLAGTLTSAGDLATQFIGGAGTYFKELAGTLTSSGSLTKRTSISLAGTLTSAGTVVKGMFISLAGTLTSTGDLARVQWKLLVGTLTSSGTLAKQTAKSFAGTLTSTGTVVKGMAVSLVGTLTSSGIVSTILNVTVIYRALTVKARSFSFTVQERSVDLVLKSRDFLLTLVDRGLE